MSELERDVAGQYSGYDVLNRVREGLARMGEDSSSVRPEALKAVDEFHIGGAQATNYLLDQLDIGSASRVLDIGSGIGGAARLIAGRFGCAVTGIDLTPDFVDTARALTEMCGMAGQVRFEVASATALPFDDGAFDLAMLLHVGMNIPDKQAVFREARRVLVSGGVFAVYDVMKVGPGELAYPVPWADTPAISALAAPEVYRSAAEAAGLALAREENRAAIALEFFARIQAQASNSAPSPLGLHQLMGPTVGIKVGNMIEAIGSGVIAPVIMIFQAPPT